MFSRSHRSHKTQGSANDQQGKGRSVHRSLLAELGLVSSNSSTARSGSSSSWGTDFDRPSYNNYANGTASARSYGAPLHPEKGRFRLSTSTFLVVSRLCWP